MFRSSLGRRPGFTLVELLVVIAIIGILVALLLPAVQQAREAARRMACGNNLKQYGVGLHTYHDVWKALPPCNQNFESAPNWNVAAVGWQARILPQMEQGPLFDKLIWDQSNPNYGANSPVLKNGAYVAASQIQVPYARCPSDSYVGGLPGQANYTGSMGSQKVTSNAGTGQPCNIFYTVRINYENVKNGNSDYGSSSDPLTLSGVFGRGGVAKMDFASMLDGTSNVIMVGEILPECHDHSGGGWWFINGAGNAHASTSCPINMLTPCATDQNDAIARNYPNPQCFDWSNWNISSAFKSRHPQGAQFVYGDGSVHFLMQQMNYTTYQRLGGRRDGQPLDSINP